MSGCCKTVGHSLQRKAVTKLGRVSDCDARSWLDPDLALEQPLSTPFMETKFHIDKALAISTLP